MIRILLVDDHELVRRGVAELLASETDLEVVGEAGSVAEGLRCAERVDADVAILDVRLPDGDGIELCRELRIRLPALRCLVFTSDDASRTDAIRAGAAGFLLKQVLGLALVDAVRAAAAGDGFLEGDGPEMVDHR